MLKLAANLPELQLNVEGMQKVSTKDKGVFWSENCVNPASWNQHCLTLTNSKPKMKFFETQVFKLPKHVRVELAWQQTISGLSFEVIKSY